MAEEKSKTQIQLTNTETKKIEDIPGELLIQEILSRLPLNSLFQTRYLSQSWHSLINTNNQTLSIHHYTQNLLNPNPNPSNLLIVSMTLGESVLQYIPDFQKCDKAITLKNLPFKSWLPKFSLVGSCNGLVCLIHLNFNSTWRGIVCNPVSGGDWIKLPVAPILGYDNDILKSVNMGFGYSLKSNEYKVIRFDASSSVCYNLYGVHYLRVTEDLPVDIVTLGRDSCWRSLGPVVPRRIFNTQAFGVFFNGCLHWLLFGDDLKVSGIWAFDVEDETFGVVPVPDVVEDKVTGGLAYLVVLKGRLAIVDYSKTDVQQHVWVMNDYGVEESWVLEFTIPTPPKPVVGAKWQCKAMLRPLGVLDNGNVVVEFDTKELHCYDPKSGTIKKLSVPGLPWAFRACPHVGTAVHLKDVIAFEEEASTTVSL